MSIAVKLPGEFVSLETLLESIADALHGSRHALPEKLADGDLNPAALAWWVAHENHRERIRSLLRLGTLRGRNATSKDRLTIYMPDAVFFINDLNDCPELQDGLFQFILDTDASNDARLALMPEAEAYKWRKAAPFDETRRTIVRNYSEHVGTTAETLRQFCDEVTSRLERWHAGRYEIAEAAQVLADKNRLDAKALCTDKEIAAHTGELVRRVNGLPIQGRPLPYRLSGHKTILQRDVNKWLEKLLRQKNLWASFGSGSLPST